MEEEWNDGTKNASVAETLQAIKDVHELAHEFMKLLFYVTFSMASLVTIAIGFWRLRDWFGL